MLILTHYIPLEKGPHYISCKFLQRKKAIYKQGFFVYNVSVKFD